jgi:hypothetical protein
MSLIEKKTIYSLKLSPSLQEHQQFFKDGTGEFTDKTICDFYRALNSFANEIAKAIGKVETPPIVPQTIPKKHNSNCGKLRGPVLTCINSIDRAVTAREILDDLAYKDIPLNRTRLAHALQELVREGKVEMVKGANSELTRFIRKQEPIYVTT